MQKLQYFAPKTIEEVFSCISQTQGKARIVAGGTDLVIFYGPSHERRSDLIDISEVSALRTIVEEDGYIVIGSAVSHNEIANNPFIKEKAKILSDACNPEKISKTMIDFAGLVEELDSAIPSTASFLLALASLNAECEIYENPHCAKWMPLIQLYREEDTTFINLSELLARIRFKQKYLQ